MDNINRDTREIMRDEMVVKDKIIESLQSGPKTIVEIANSIAAPSPEVMFWVMAMRKYGSIKEGEVTEDDYFLYELKEEE